MKKKLALAVVLLLLVNSVFAAGFTDLGKVTWAEAYINRLAQMGILTGYSDGTYRPLENVSKYAAILVTYRTLDSQGLISADDAVVYKNRYASTLAKYSVPNWPMLHEAVAYCIEKQIMAPEDLTGFVISGKHQSISRETMAKYLGKALNQYFNEDVNKVISLDYKDVQKIDFESLKYVNILSEHKIISGDGNGYFNPKKPLNRAALAKLLVTSVDELANTKNVNNKEVIASIYAKLDDTRKIVFYEKDSATESHIEKIDDNVEVVIGGKKAGYNDLQVDMPVVLTYANEKLLKVTADAKPTETEVVTGQVTEVLSFNNKNYVYFINDKTTKTDFYELDDTVKILKEDKSGALTDIKKGDVITVTLSNDKVYSLSYKPRFKTFKGVIKSISSKNGYSLTIGIGTGELSLPVKDVVEITRNDASKTFSDLLIGDEVTIETDLDKISKIIATGADSKVVGVIAKIDIGSKYKVTVKDVSGNLTTYTLAKDVVVFIDGEAKTYYDLRIDYMITASLKDGAMIRIDATTKVEKAHVVGKVEKVLPEVNTIIVKTDVSYTINTNSDTLFIDANGGKTAFNNIEKGDTVFVYGIGKDRVISADKVLILQK